MSPDPEASLEALRRFVVRELIKDEEAEIGSSEPLFSSGLLDSFSVTPLILFLEDFFGIAIPASQVRLDDFDTLEGILGVVARFSGRPAEPR